MRKHDEHLGHLLWEVSSRISALGDARFAAIDLSRPSLGVLDIIATTPGISATELSKHSGKSQQAASQVVARLEALGHVERRLVKGRTIGLYLTPAGTKIRNTGATLERALEKELEDILGRERFEKLRKLLLDTRPLVRGLDKKWGKGDGPR